MLVERITGIPDVFQTINEFVFFGSVFSNDKG